MESLQSIFDALIQRRPELEVCLPDLKEAIHLLISGFEGRGKLLVCGNGGSASDSEHIVGELMKGFLLPRPLSATERDSLIQAAGPDEGQPLAASLQGALPAIALTSHGALSTAISNDNGPDLAFAQQVHGLGNSGDMLLGISTSGNARNVVNAFYVAKARGMKTISLTGSKGGLLAPLADVALRAPATAVVEIQELHLPLYHTLCAAVELHFFGGTP